jgi:hypothetical protein
MRWVFVWFSKSPTKPKNAASMSAPILFAYTGTGRTVTAETEKTTANINAVILFVNTVLTSSPPPHRLPSAPVLMVFFGFLSFYHKGGGLFILSIEYIP